MTDDEILAELGAKTQALVMEDRARRRPAPGAPERLQPGQPKLGHVYPAGTLPAGSVAGWGLDEYVIGQTGLCLLWDQPIPGSDTRKVTYTGRLPEAQLASDDWMTPRMRAQVDEVKEWPVHAGQGVLVWACCVSHMGPACRHRQAP